MAEEAELKLKNLTVDNEAEIKLFTSKFSPFGQRVVVALKEKKIPFQAIDVDFNNKPQELLEANPIHKQIPTIIHKGKPVVESVVILLYLEEAFPEQVPLMPQDAYEKSKFRFWIDYVYKASSTVFNGFRVKPGTPEKQAAIEESMKILKTLEKGMTSFSAEGPFFTGEKFGMIDVALASFCNAGPVVQAFGGIVIPGPDQLPRLNKWIQAVKVHPSVSSTIPPGEETVAHIKEVFARRVVAAAAS